MNRLQELRDQIAQQNKGLHYLKQAHESDFVEALCAEIDTYRKDIEGVLEECSKHIGLSNDFPWTEEVYCALRSLAKSAPPLPGGTLVDGKDGERLDWLDAHIGYLELKVGREGTIRQHIDAAMSAQAAAGRDEKP